MSQYKATETDGANKLESPRYGSEAATEVAAVVIVLNVPKLAEVLSTSLRPGANREDCTVIAVV